MKYWYDLLIRRLTLFYSLIAILRFLKALHQLEVITINWLFCYGTHAGTVVLRRVFAMKRRAFLVSQFLSFWTLPDGDNRNCEIAPEEVF